MQMVRKTVDDIRALLTEHSDIAYKTTDTSQYSRRQLSRILTAMDSDSIMQTLLVYLDKLSEHSMNIEVDSFSKIVDCQKWLQVMQAVIFPLLRDRRQQRH